MLNSFISKKITEQLSFSPTEEQELLIDKLSDFLMSQKTDELFLLKGYAGTGKTSIVGALIKALTEFKQKTVLMAPTGRAAKVFTSYSGQTAWTIHKKIYRQKSITESRFQLTDNLHKHTLFIVDEASMISNGGMSDSIFGSGRLLDDLISYIYSGEGCRLLLLGDDAQLSPIGQNDSPALNSDYLQGFSLNVEQFCLQQVVRQGRDSGILHNATLLRQQIQENNFGPKPQFELNDFTDFKSISGADLIETLNKVYNTVGVENSIVITRSNKQANLYNKGIRLQVLQKEDEISAGDLLMITKNNYYWAKDYEQLEFIANGDIVEITRVRRYYEIYDLRFADVSLRFLDYDYELDARILLDSLHTETPAAAEELNKKLFANVSEDYADIGNKRERMKQLTANEYYCSLQVKFGYAVTCHKAQGGQWDTVMIDQGYVGDELTEDYYHWMYTALTRSSSSLYLINLPKEYFKQ